jgi:uncharacterized protein (DUF2141 family)
MKRYRFFLAVLVIFLLAIAAGCGKKDPVKPTPTTGTISGTVGLYNSIGFQIGTVANARVALFSSYPDFQADRYTKVVYSSASGAYSFTDVAPGTYYVDAWKDNDGNQDFSSGDYYGWYGSINDPYSITVTAGNTAKIDIRLYEE